MNMTLQWYINDKGVLCVGKLPRHPDHSQYDSSTPHRIFKIETDIKPPVTISAPVTEEHVKTIGSYPEDWPHDSFIAEKIAAAARLIFGDFSASGDFKFAYPKN
jgi:hypothetical protein